MGIGVPGIDECLLQAMLVPGARGASIVDWISGLALGTVGESAGGDHESTAAETAELARMATEYTAFVAQEPSMLGGGPPGGHDGPADAKDDGPALEDLIVTTRTCYHLVRFVDTRIDSSVYLHLWLDRDLGNLALARIRLQNLAEELVLG